MARPYVPFSANETPLWVERTSEHGKEKQRDAQRERRCHAASPLSTDTCLMLKQALLALLPAIAYAGHCSRPGQPGYCCSIGCDSSYCPQFQGNRWDANACDCSKEGSVTLAQIYAIAASGGCAPLTEGS